jgi:putative oxidoreductase
LFTLEFLRLWSAGSSAGGVIGARGGWSSAIGRYKKGVTVEYLQNFDITNQMNILRLICGLFFVPHIYAKFFVPEALGFFTASRVKQPKVWLYAACVMETIVVVGLVFAIFPFWAALLGCLHLLVALSFVWKVTKGKWLWNVGGYEYCLFWAICCLVVAMDYYRGGHLSI